MRHRFLSIAGKSCVAGAVGFAGLVHAQIYKCPDATGKITYQQTRCQANSTQGNIKIEPSLPTLAQKEPEGRIVDQCIKLHEFAPDSPTDFLIESAIYAPVGDGSWLLAISGTSGKPAARAPQTLRCPVAGNGAINLELWRAQSALGSMQRDKRAEQSTAVKGVSAAAAGAPARDAPRVSSADKAGERKFIESRIRSGRLSEDQVRQALGEPDRYGSILGTCLLPVSRTPYACKLATWIYLPTEQDQQTRTTITFSQEGEAVDVTRAMQY